jgi:hypothetical protein
LPRPDKSGLAMTMGDWSAITWEVNVAANKYRQSGAAGSGLTPSHGDEDLVSHEDKHSQDDSKANKSKFGSEVIRYNC